MSSIQQGNEFEVWLNCAKNKIISSRLLCYAQELVDKLILREKEIRAACLSFLTPCVELFHSMHNAIGISVEYRNPCTSEMVIAALMWICAEEFSHHYNSKISIIIDNIMKHCGKTKFTRILQTVDLLPLSRFILFVQVSIDLSLAHNKRRRVMKLSCLCDSPNLVYIGGANAFKEARVREAIIFVMLSPPCLIRHSRQIQRVENDRALLNLDFDFDVDQIEVPYIPVIVCNFDDDGLEDFIF